MFNFTIEECHTCPSCTRIHPGDCCPWCERAWFEYPEDADQLRQEISDYMNQREYNQFLTDQTEYEANGVGCEEGISF